MSNKLTESIYGNRMINYYPPVIANITDFRALIGAEFPEVESLYDAKEEVLDNAFFTTMNESRIKEWENALKIVPLADSTIEDRRDVIISRIRGQGKLNSATIKSIVNSFTYGSAKSWIEDGTLYVEITPPANNKQYRFENVEAALRNKVPLHIGLVVRRNYTEWDLLLDVSAQDKTWQGVYDRHETWEDVLL